jgi:hypothetical protein
MSFIIALVPNIDFCLYYSEAWIKKPEYCKCWKYSKSLSSVIVTTFRESDDIGDVLIDMAVVVVKAVEEGYFWMAFNEVMKSELVSLLFYNS